MPARVWDSFLTEQDRAHLALSRHRNIGFGERPALLLIDLYRWVFGDQPELLLEAIKTWPSSCGLAGWQPPGRRALCGSSNLVPRSPRPDPWTLKRQTKLCHPQTNQDGPEPP